jgi:peroxiredoxin
MNEHWAFGIVLAWIAILAGGWLGWQLLRQNGRLLLRLDELEQRLNELEFGEGEEPAGLSIGSAAPDFELPDVAGGFHTLAQYRSQSLLLIFFNPACGFCKEMLPKLKDRLESRTQKAEEDGLSVLVISTADAEASSALFAEHKLTCAVLLQKQTEVATAYRANGTPCGYLISAEGQIASELAMGADRLLELLEGEPESRKQKAKLATVAGNGNGGEKANRFSNRSLAHSRIKRDGLRAGTQAPEFRLPRLDGRGDLSLSELRGRPVLLVFSSPNCGPCATLAPQLEEFHRGNPDLEVVMISKGEPKENRAKVKEHGLTFPIVLQQQWEISRRYAMFATPVAYLIDQEGIITCDVAVGSEAIVGLFTSQNGKRL